MPSLLEELSLRHGRRTGVEVYSPLRPLRPPVRQTGRTADAGTASRILAPGPSPLPVPGMPGQAVSLSMGGQGQQLPGYTPPGQRQGSQLYGDLPQQLAQPQEDQPGWKSALGFAANSPIGQAVMGALNAIDVPRRMVVSTVQEVADTFNGGDADFGDWWEQVQDETFGFGDVVPDTGNKWLDRIIGFGGDVLLDPTTYLFGAGVVAGTGRRIRLTAAARAFEHGLPEIGEKLARRGYAALDDAEHAIFHDVAGDTIKRRGYYWKTPIVGRQYHRLPFSGRADQFFGSIGSHTRMWLNDRRVLSAVRRWNSDMALSQAIERMVSPRSHVGMSFGEAATVYTYRTARGKAEKIFRGRLGGVLTNTLRQIGNTELTRQFVNLEQQGGTDLHAWFALAADLAQKAGVRFPNGLIPNYLPHYYTPDGIKWLKGNNPNAVAVRNLFFKDINIDDISPILMERQIVGRDTPYKIGDLEMFIPNGTADEINKEFRRIVPDAKFDLIETRAEVVMRRYMEDLIDDVGTVVGAKALAKSRSGLVRRAADFEDDDVSDELLEEVIGKIADEPTARSLKSDLDKAKRKVRALRTQRLSKVSKVQGELGTHMRQITAGLDEVPEATRKRIDDLILEEQRLGSEAVRLRAEAAKATPATPAAAAAVPDVEAAIPSTAAPKLADGTPVPTPLVKELDDAADALERKSDDLIDEMLKLQPKAIEEMDIVRAAQEQFARDGKLTTPVPADFPALRAFEEAGMRNAEIRSQLEQLQQIRDMAAESAAHATALSERIEDLSFVSLAARNDPLYPEAGPGEVRELINGVPHHRTIVTESGGGATTATVRAHYEALRQEKLAKFTGAEYLKTEVNAALVRVKTAEDKLDAAVMAQRPVMDQTKQKYEWAKGLERRREADIDALTPYPEMRSEVRQQRQDLARFRESVVGPANEAALAARKPVDDAQYEVREANRALDALKRRQKSAAAESAAQTTLEEIGAPPALEFDDVQWLGIEQRREELVAELAALDQAASARRHGREPVSIRTLGIQNREARQRIQAEIDNIDLAILRAKGILGATVEVVDGNVNFVHGVNPAADDYAARYRDPLITQLAAARREIGDTDDAIRASRTKGQLELQGAQEAELTAASRLKALERRFEQWERTAASPSLTPEMTLGPEARYINPDTGEVRTESMAAARLRQQRAEHISAIQQAKDDLATATRKRQSATRKAGSEGYRAVQGGVDAERDAVLALRDVQREYDLWKIHMTDKRHPDFEKVAASRPQVQAKRVEYEERLKSLKTTLDDARSRRRNLERAHGGRGASLYQRHIRARRRADVLQRALDRANERLVRIGGELYEQNRRARTELIEQLRHKAALARRVSVLDTEWEHAGLRRAQAIEEEMGTIAGKRAAQAKSIEKRKAWELREAQRQGHTPAALEAQLNQVIADRDAFLQTRLGRKAIADIEAFNAESVRLAPLLASTDPAVKRDALADLGYARTQLAENLDDYTGGRDFEAEIGDLAEQLQEARTTAQSRVEAEMDRLNVAEASALLMAERNRPYSKYIYTAVEPVPDPPTMWDAVGLDAVREGLEIVSRAEHRLSHGATPLPIDEVQEGLRRISELRRSLGSLKDLTPEQQAALKASPRSKGGPSGTIPSAQEAHHVAKVTLQNHAKKLVDAKAIGTGEVEWVQGLADEMGRLLELHGDMPLPNIKSQIRQVTADLNRWSGFMLRYSGVLESGMKPSEPLASYLFQLELKSELKNLQNQIADLRKQVKRNEQGITLGSAYRTKLDEYDRDIAVAQTQAKALQDKRDIQGIALTDAEKKELNGHLQKISAKGRARRDLARQGEPIEDEMLQEAADSLTHLLKTRFNDYVRSKSTWSAHMKESTGDYAPAQKAARLRSTIQVEEAQLATQKAAVEELTDAINEAESSGLSIVLHRPNDWLKYSVSPEEARRMVAAGDVPVEQEADVLRRANIMEARIRRNDPRLRKTTIEWSVYGPGEIRQVTMDQAYRELADRDATNRLLATNIANSQMELQVVEGKGATLREHLKIALQDLETPPNVNALQAENAAIESAANKRYVFGGDVNYTEAEQAIVDLNNFRIQRAGQTIGDDEAQRLTQQIDKLEEMITAESERMLDNKAFVTGKVDAIEQLLKDLVEGRRVMGPDEMRAMRDIAGGDIALQMGTWIRFVNNWLWDQQSMTPENVADMFQQVYDTMLTVPGLVRGDSVFGSEFIDAVRRGERMPTVEDMENLKILLGSIATPESGEIVRRIDDAMTARGAMTEDEQVDMIVDLQRLFGENKLGERLMGAVAGAQAGAEGMAYEAARGMLYTNIKGGFEAQMMNDQRAISELLNLLGLVVPVNTSGARVRQAAVEAGRDGIPASARDIVEPGSSITHIKALGFNIETGIMTDTQKLRDFIVNNAIAAGWTPDTAVQRRLDQANSRKATIELMLHGFGQFDARKVGMRHPEATFRKIQRYEAIDAGVTIRSAADYMDLTDPEGLEAAFANSVTMLEREIGEATKRKDRQRVIDLTEELAELKQGVLPQAAVPPMPVVPPTAVKPMADADPFDYEQHAALTSELQVAQGRLEEAERKLTTAVGEPPEDSLVGMAARAEPPGELMTHAQQLVAMREVGPLMADPATQQQGMDLMLAINARAWKNEPAADRQAASALDALERQMGTDHPASAFRNADQAEVATLTETREMARNDVERVSTLLDDMGPPPRARTPEITDEAIEDVTKRIDPRTEYRLKRTEQIASDTAMTPEQIEEEFAAVTSEFNSLIERYGNYDSAPGDAQKRLGQLAARSKRLKELQPEAIVNANQPLDEVPGYAQYLEQMASRTIDQPGHHFDWRHIAKYATPSIEVARDLSGTAVHAGEAGFAEGKGRFSMFQGVLGMSMNRRRSTGPHSRARALLDIEQDALQQRIDPTLTLQAKLKAGFEAAHGEEARLTGEADALEQLIRSGEFGPAYEPTPPGTLPPEVAPTAAPEQRVAASAAAHGDRLGRLTMRHRAAFSSWKRAQKRGAPAEEIARLRAFERQEKAALNAARAAAAAPTVAEQQAESGISWWEPSPPGTTLGASTAPGRTPPAATPAAPEVVRSGPQRLTHEEEYAGWGDVHTPTDAEVQAAMQIGAEARAAGAIHFDWYGPHLVDEPSNPRRLGPIQLPAGMRAPPGYHLQGSGPGQLGIDLGIPTMGIHGDTGSMKRADDLWNLGYRTAEEVRAVGDPADIVAKKIRAQIPDAVIPPAATAVPPTAPPPSAAPTVEPEEVLGPAKPPKAPAKKTAKAKAKEAAEDAYTDELAKTESSLADVRRQIAAAQAQLTPKLEADKHAFVKRALEAKPTSSAEARALIDDMRAVNDLRRGSDATPEEIASIEAMLDSSVRLEEKLDAAEVAEAELTKRILEMGKAAPSVAPVVAKLVTDGWKPLASKHLTGEDAVYVSNNLAAALVNVQQAMSQPGGWNLLDKYVAFFKTYAVGRPGFHVRNAISGVFMNYVDGVSTRAQLEAMPVWHRFMKDPNKFLDPNGGEDELLRNAIEIVLSSGSGGPYMEQGVAALNPRQYGSRIYRRIMDNWFTRANRRAGSYVEGTMRLGMAIDSLRKGMSVESAAARVTKFHFDYTEIGRLDSQARRLIPFWTFMSRNIPLQLEEMFMRPAIYQRYRSLVRNFREDDDPLTPKYWLQQGAFTMNEDAENAEAPWYLAPDLPHLRVLEPVSALTEGDLGKALLSDINPAIIAPIEAYAAGKKFYSGSPIGDSYREASGPMEGIAAILNMIGLGGETGASGQNVIDERIAHVARSTNPVLDFAERLFDQTGIRAGRADETLLRAIGVPALQLTPEMRANTARSEYFDRRDRLRKQAELARM